MTPTVEQIQRTAAEYYDVDLTQMLGRRRFPSLVWPRYVAMSVCKLSTEESYTSIAKSFNRKCHSNVIHAVRKVSRQARTDSSIAREMNAIKEIAISRSRGNTQ